MWCQAEIAPQSLRSWENSLLQSLLGWRHQRREPLCDPEIM
jgi:hypothetical protein